MIKALLLSLVCVLTLAACGGSGEDPLVNEATSEVSVFGFQFDHPADLQVTTETDDFVEYCFESEQDTRHPRCLQFSAEGDDLQGVDHETAEVESGATFDYVNRSVDGGSGGVEHRLLGHLDVGNRVVFVRANAAEEAGHSDATWSLPLIRTVRPA